jgi:hypothetical protein
MGSPEIEIPVLKTKKVIYKHKNLQREVETIYYTKNHTLFSLHATVIDKGRRGTTPMIYPPTEIIYTMSRISCEKNGEFIEGALNRARNRLYHYIYITQILNDSSIFPGELSKIIKKYLYLTYRTTRIKL